jgi:hypothetical protein
MHLTNALIPDSIVSAHVYRHCIQQLQGNFGKLIMSSMALRGIIAYLNRLFI